MNTEKNLRIDYSKYQVDEVVETISDAILFPFYIGKVALTVVVVFAIAIGFLSAYVTDNVWFALLFFLLTYIISLPSIVLVSAVRLIHTINNDVNKVMEICVDTTNYVYKDLLLLREQNKEGLPATTSFKDVFRGVSFYVIRPSLNRVLTSKIKFMAPPFVFLMDQIFRFVVMRKQPEYTIPDPKTLPTQSTEKASLDIKIKQGSSKATSTTVKIITAPLYFLLFVYGIVNFLLAWLFGVLL